MTIDGEGGAYLDKVGGGMRKSILKGFPFQKILATRRGDQLNMTVDDERGGALDRSNPP